MSTNTVDEFGHKSIKQWIFEKQRCWPDKLSAQSTNAVKGLRMYNHGCGFFKNE